MTGNISTSLIAVATSATVVMGGHSPTKMGAFTVMDPYSNRYSNVRLGMCINARAFNVDGAQPVPFLKEEWVKANSVSSFQNTTEPVVEGQYSSKRTEDSSDVTRQYGADVKIPPVPVEAVGTVGGDGDFDTTHKKNTNDVHASYVAYQIYNTESLDFKDKNSKFTKNDIIQNRKYVDCTHVITTINYGSMVHGSISAFEEGESWTSSQKAHVEAKIDKIGEKIQNLQTDTKVTNMDKDSKDFSNISLQIKTKGFSVQDRKKIVAEAEENTEGQDFKAKQLYKMMLMASKVGEVSQESKTPLRFVFTPLADWHDDREKDLSINTMYEPEMQLVNRQTDILNRIGDLQRYITNNWVDVVDSATDATGECLQAVQSARQDVLNLVEDFNRCRMAMSNPSDASTVLPCTEKLTQELNEKEYSSISIDGLFGKYGYLAKNPSCQKLEQAIQGKDTALTSRWALLPQLKTKLDAWWNDKYIQDNLHDTEWIYKEPQIHDKDGSYSAEMQKFFYYKYEDMLNLFAKVKYMSVQQGLTVKGSVASEVEALQSKWYKELDEFYAKGQNWRREGTNCLSSNQPVAKFMVYGLKNHLDPLKEWLDQRL